MSEIHVHRDYRQVILHRWVQGGDGVFTPPSPEELLFQARLHKPLIDRFIPPNRASAILEIGCGYGGLVSALVDRGYGNITATDLLPECCAFVEEHTGIKTRCADVFDFFAGDDRRYDAIIALDVIEHFNKNEIVAIVDRIHAVLNPGGIFIMRVPNGSSLSGISTRFSGFTHEVAFTQHSIKELFSAIGFVGVECVPDPVYAKTPLRGAIKGAMRWASERIVSLCALRYISPEFAVSQNITGVGRKR